MTVLKTRAWPWFALAVVLIAVGLFVIAGAVGTIVLAVGFLTLFGAGVRVVSRRDTRTEETRRVPAGHSGV
jgi:hypothetical protein